MLAFPGQKTVGPTFGLLLRLVAIFFMLFLTTFGCCGYIDGDYLAYDF